MTQGPPTELVQPEQQPKQQPLRDRVLNAIGVFGRFRALVAALGVVGFAVGIDVAWRADSAATLIVASAVLIVAAMFGANWQEVRAAYGGAELLLRQSRDEAVVEAVTDSGSFEEFRGRVERIEEQFAAIESAQHLDERKNELARQLASRKRSRQAVTRQTSAVAEALTSSANVEHVITNAGVFLRLTMSGGLGRLISCDVVDPAGERRTSIPRITVAAPVVLFGAPSTYETVYPSAFGVEEALEPGPYLVEWKSKAMLLVMAAAEVVARDAFTIEGDWEQAE